MSQAVVFAFGAAATGVAGAWELLASAEALPGAGWVRRVLRPLVLARATGRTPSTAERRRLALLAAVSVFAAGWLLVGPLLALPAAVAGPIVVAALLARRRAAYRTRLAGEAATAARALAAALAAGRTVRSAVAEAARGLTGPAAVELARCAAELDAGAGTETALVALRERAASPAWNATIAAILLQREAGGDLPGLLRDLATALEAAERADQDARAATAQARFTAQIVGGLPLVAVALAELIAPGFLIGLLSDPVSAVLVILAAILQVVALVAVRSINRRLVAA